MKIEKLLKIVTFLNLIWAIICYTIIYISDMHTFKISSYYLVIVSILGIAMLWWIFWPVKHKRLISYIFIFPSIVTVCNRLNEPNELGNSQTIFLVGGTLVIIIISIFIIAKS